MEDSVVGKGHQRADRLWQPSTDRDPGGTELTRKRQQWINRCGCEIYFIGCPRPFLFSTKRT